MSESALAKPYLDDLVGPALAAVATGELPLPPLADSAEPLGAPLGDDATGFGVISDSTTGVRVIVPPYRLVRETVEYQNHFADYAAALQAAANGGTSIFEAAELALEDSVHQFLHDAYEADATGGDTALDEFLFNGLLPQAALTWALLDAYATMVNRELPEAGGEPLGVTEDMFGDIDPYANEGRALVAELWAHTESELHPASVHAPYEVMAARKLKPVSKKARKHAQRTRGR